MRTKRKKRASGPKPRWRTVRVSWDTHERIDVIARGLKRPHSFVVADAIARYVIIDSLHKDAQIGQRLEVRA